jgi:hypothetical protein
VKKKNLHDNVKSFPHHSYILLSLSLNQAVSTSFLLPPQGKGVEERETCNENQCKYEKFNLIAKW